MRIKTFFATVIFALGASACAPIIEQPTRLSSIDAGPSVAVVDPSQWHVKDVRVNVPRTLHVSEANMFYPIADIVWRGDPYGDRYEQVAKIIDDAVTQGVQHLHGRQEVYIDIDVLRFHALTEKARLFVGGTHSIRYMMTVRDAKTGAILVGPTEVVADIVALGGRKAIEAERRGITQKVRITSHLAAMTREMFEGAEVDARRMADNG